MIPADIKKPAKTKNIKLNSKSDEELGKCFSKITRNTPKISEKIKYIRKLNLNFCLEVACLKSDGIHPNN